MEDEVGSLTLFCSKIEEAATCRCEEATPSRGQASRVWRHRGPGPQDPPAAPERQPARWRRRLAARRSRGSGEAKRVEEGHAEGEEGEDQGGELPEVDVRPVRVVGCWWFGMLGERPWNTCILLRMSCIFHFVWGHHGNSEGDYMRPEPVRNFVAHYLIFPRVYTAAQLRTALAHAAPLDLVRKILDLLLLLLLLADR